MFDVEVQEERRKRKQELQQKYLQKAAEKSEKNKKKITKETNWKEKYEEEKRLRKQLQKKLKKIEKNEDAWKDKQRFWNEEKVKERRKTERKMNENRSKNKVIQELNQQVKNLQKELELHEDEMKRLQMKIEVQEKKKQNLPNHLYKVNQDLRTKNEELKQKIGVLQQKVKINHTLKRDEEHDGYKKEIKHLRERNKELGEKVRSYEDVHTPDNLLYILKDLITEENLIHFFENNKNRFDLLSEKVARIKQEQKERKKKNPKVSSLMNLLTTEKEENLKMGFISKKGSVWYFFETNLNDEEEYEVYEVIGNTSNHKFAQDLPVKCWIREEDDKATVIKVYEQHELPEPMTQMFRLKEKEEKKEKREYAFFGDAKVLIIGSRNMAEYQQRLKKHGLEVEIHNPFEENYHRIEGKCQRADVIVVCTSHISHATMNHINKKDPKVELIERDSEEWIAARVRFALAKHDPSNSIKIS